MNVSYRTLSNIILLSVFIALSGVLSDADHLFALLRWSTNARWFHKYLVLHPLAFISCVVIWGIIAFALAIRWDIIKTGDK